MFHRTSRELSLENLNHSVYKYFTVHFHQNSFVESDPTKNCVDYPNNQYESYSQCDEHFVREAIINTRTIDLNNMNVGFVIFCSKI